MEKTCLFSKNRNCEFYKSIESHYEGTVWRCWLDNEKNRPAFCIEYCRVEVERIKERLGYRNGEIWVAKLKVPRARKRYECDVCGEVIPIGRHYVNEVALNTESPGYNSVRIHGECWLDEKSSAASEMTDRPVWRWGPR